MFLLTKPSEAFIEKFLEARVEDAFSYKEVGASQTGVAPQGYNFDHYRIQVGTGRNSFEKAKSALQSWKMFEMPWVRLCPANARIKAGETVAALIRHFGFWSLNASRIVYVIEEIGEIEKHGFAYGTLINHAEQGEERFTVEYHSGNDKVWYDLLAFSKPKHVLARAGYPISRALQKQFADESQKSMLRNTAR